MKESILDVLLYLFEHYFAEDAAPPLGDRDALNNGTLFTELTEAGFARLEAARPRVEAADRRIARVLWNDPGTGVMRHADAGYEIARQCAREQGLKLPMLG